MILDFKAEGNTNLVLQFLCFLGKNGYQAEFFQDFFFAEATCDVTGHKILVGEVTNHTNTRELNLIRGVSPHDKVIFVDYGDGKQYWYSLWPALSGSMGAYVYDVRSGWIYKPGVNDTEALRRNLLARSDRFTEIDGELHKICRVCGSILPVSEFYLKPRVTRNSVDPYRNNCKDCSKRGA